MQCDGDGESQVACSFGCKGEAEGEPARCRVFDPQGVASSADLLRGGLGDLEIEEGDRIILATGEIIRSNNILRQANDGGNSNQIKNNLLFRVEVDPRTSDQQEVAVLVARNLIIRGTPTFERGTKPLMLVAQQELKVLSLLQIPCGKLGGRAGGMPERNANGLGAGRYQNGSAGGGGHGTAGALGGRSSTGNGGGAGQVINTSYVLGGGGGGGGGQLFDASGKGAQGGDGGGAIALIAGRTLVLGDGGASPQGVHASGCGGGVYHPNQQQRVGGSGGGAGGFIQIEAPQIEIASNAGLVANGGGGAGWTGTGWKEGANGAFSSTPAAGGGTLRVSCSGNVGHNQGGNGAAGETAATKGVDAVTDCAQASYGGGGGGGAGRILVLSTTTAPLPESMLLSPRLDSAVRYGQSTVEE